MIFYTVYRTESRTIRTKICDIHKINPYATSDYDLDNCKCIFETTFSVTEYEYGTNDDGEGLFRRNNAGELNQLTGLMQFYAKDKNHLLRQLNTYFIVKEPFERFFGTRNGAKNYLTKNNLEEKK